MGNAGALNPSERSRPYIEKKDKGSTALIWMVYGWIALICRDSKSELFKELNRALNSTC